VDIQLIREMAVYIIPLVVGLIAGALLHKASSERKVSSAKARAKDIIAQADKEAQAKKKEAILEAKEELYREKADVERELREKRQEIQKVERRLDAREENLDKKTEQMEQRQKELVRKEKKAVEREERLQELETDYKQLVEKEMAHLENISQMTASEAKEELISRMESQARAEASGRLKRIEEEIRQTAKIKAQEIVSYSIQKCASEHVAETTVSVVDLPNDEMKGRIIGREGRNIRALEIATGVDLIIDDTPEAIILSAFDPFKREIARRALERLMSDGRIHPGRIEDVVNKVKKEMNGIIKEEGEQAAFDVGVEGLHAEVIKLLGKLKYRSSYSQNVLFHSKEVANLCGAMAAELGDDVQIAKRAGLLHDIGKAVDQQTEGSHTQIGVDLAKRYNEPKIVVEAIAAHHQDVEANSVVAVLLQAADTLSAARPGARREMLETYIKRLQSLEEIADSFKGVDKAYAIQAGREIRVIVTPEQVKDHEVGYLAMDIAKKIEDELAYPGEIRVTVIRETRAVQFAK
jgi:ribonuclease Y